MTDFASDRAARAAAGAAVAGRGEVVRARNGEPRRRTTRLAFLEVRLEGSYRYPERAICQAGSILQATSLRSQPS